MPVLFRVQIQFVVIRVRELVFSNRVPTRKFVRAGDKDAQTRDASVQSLCQSLSWFESFRACIRRHLLVFYISGGKMSAKTKGRGRKAGKTQENVIGKHITENCFA